MLDPKKVEESVMEVTANWLAIQMAQSQTPFCRLKTLLETIADEAVELYDEEKENFLNPI